MNLPIRGLVAAPFTPFRTDGTLQLELIPRLAHSLQSQEVSGAFICGTTGEGASMTLEERKQVAEAWRRSAGDRFAVIVHVGHNCLADSMELARHAQAIGADAIGAIAPSFFKPAGVAALVQFCVKVAAAAPRLPFYYYHLPAMTGVDVSIADFLEQAAVQIPNLAGIKFTHENLMDYAQARAAAGGRFDILFGRDEILLSGLALGAQGAVGSTYNYAARLYHDIFAAVARGDLAAAQERQLASMRMITTFLRYGGLNAQKAMMKMCGYDCGPVRLPLSDLAPDSVRALERALREQDFFAYADRAA